MTALIVLAIVAGAGLVAWYVRRLALAAERLLSAVEKAQRLNRARLMDELGMR